ncbi:hypothetical protein [Mesorhizobium sp. CO1-1-7]|uniref:hypothetical protein n=1 Tax=Mesorhizobium sp. CO1-1-7 TaxID=2876632 RepID=UPI001CD17DF7|nr:hypothetical protein [Mesorhizobium sp. CO1-1-7]
MAGLSIVLSHKAVRRESFHELALMISQVPVHEQPDKRQPPGSCLPEKYEFFPIWR